MFQIFVKVWARKVQSLPGKHRDTYYLWAVQQMPGLSEGHGHCPCHAAVAVSAVEITCPAAVLKSSARTVMAFWWLGAYYVCLLWALLHLKHVQHCHWWQHRGLHITCHHHLPSAVRAAAGYHSGRTRAQRKNTSASLWELSCGKHQSFLLSSRR